MNVKLGLLFTLAMFTMTISFSSAYAGGSQPQGNWYIYYYSAGSGCTGSPYAPTLKDGGGFAVNQPPKNNHDPIVPGGSSIDVKINVTGAAMNTKYYYEVDSDYGPVPLLTTDNKGDGSACITVKMPINSKTAGTCTTDPEKIGTSTKPKDFFGQPIDHFLTGSNCTTSPPTSVPEFAFGLPLLISLMLPTLILLKKRVMAN